MLIDLDQPQPPVVVLIQYRLDAGGFPRSAVPVQQAVIGLSSRYKCLRIVNQLLLLHLITDQMIQRHITCMCDR